MSAGGFALVHGTLDPTAKLACAAADWLAARARETPEGAISLAHFLVAVPTAQSARTLRLELARRFHGRGLVPPAVAMPAMLLATDGAANPAEELAAAAQTLLDAAPEDFSALFPAPPDRRDAPWAVAMASQLLSIQQILGEGALTMQEVVCEEDAARWKDLAEFERRFFAALAAAGVTPSALARKEAAAAGCAMPQVEEIVLPALADATPAFVKYLENSHRTVHVLLHAREDETDGFDDWGRPIRHFARPLRTSRVEASPDTVTEADAVARHFASVPPSCVLPALVACDAESFPELEGAFGNLFPPEELLLANPADLPFPRSSLGRLLETLRELSETGSFEAFSTFARTGDAARWAAAELGATPAETAECIEALDAIAAERMPATVADCATAARDAATTWRDVRLREAAGRLARLAEAVMREADSPFSFLEKIFAPLTLDGREPSHRELAAAAECCRSLRANCESPAVPPHLRAAVFQTLAAKAGFSLEPDSREILPAHGWLETQWLPENEVVFAGFNEGCVPASIAGHPFVPDSLRAKLGLRTNESRGLRDAYILYEALGCRPDGAVSIHLHQIAGDKSVAKPSRLLFPCVSDAELPGFAMRLYAVGCGRGSAPAKSVPSAWRLSLPFPPEGKTWRKKISVSKLDAYRKDPFRFLLRETFGEKLREPAPELGADGFGTMCHAALEAFAGSALRDSTDAAAIAAFLEKAVREWLSRFPSPLPAAIELQGEAAAERLAHFARIQAARRAEGWRIIASERPFQCTLKGRPTVISGKIDRIDRREGDGAIAIIDYKTWDRPPSAGDRDGKIGIQLPAYRSMLEASGAYGAAAADSVALYCILAADADNACFDMRPGFCFRRDTQSMEEDRIVGLLDSLAEGIFWPCAPGKSPFDDGTDALIPDGAAEAVEPEWLADQLRRIERHV